MKILLYLEIAILLLLSACESNQQTENTEKSVTKEQETNIANDSLTNRDRATQDIDGFLAALPGKWQRTTYPYGTVKFKRNKVKFVTGEGAVEPPQFQRFQLSDSCPYSTDKEQISTYPYFMVSEENQTCKSIKLNKDFLSIGIQYNAPGSAGEIVYAKVPNGESSNATNKNQNNIIPKSFQSKWAIGKRNCGVRNHQQITVNAKSIQFFEKRSELGEILKHSSTWIMGHFNHKSSDDQSVFYSPTLLETRQNGKVLLVQEYAKEPYPEATQYERCE